MVKKYFLLTAGGVDRKGIVFWLTKILKKYGFNIEDSSMIMLRHTFSVIVLLSIGEAAGGAALKKFRSEIDSFMNKSGMSAGIREISDGEMKEYREEGRKYILSISGADKPGIVNSMTGILYENGINILDMETKSSQNTSPAAYYMFLEVDVPKKVNIGTLGRALRDAGKKIGVHVSINRVESEVL